MKNVIKKLDLWLLKKEILMSDIKEIVEDENKIDTVIADDIDFRGTLKFKN